MVRNLQNNICVAPFRSWPMTNCMTCISVAIPRGIHGDSDSIGLRNMRAISAKCS